MYQGQPAGRLPYAGLGGFLEDVSALADRLKGKIRDAQAVESATRDVVSGQSSVAVIPKDRATFTIPLPGQSYGATIPLVPVALGLVALLLFMRRR